jgi:hypothetical protein
MAVAEVAGDRAAAQIPAEHPVPLWRNLQFQTLWIGQAASTLGISVADVAYPLAILALTGSPARAGLFAALQATGMLLAGLPAGQLADRHDRRTVVILAEAGSALVSALVAAGLVLGWLSLPALLGAAAVLGAGQAVASAARLPLVRSVVPGQQLTSALVQDEVRANGAALAGPPLAGALYALRALAHAVPFVFTAGSLLVSALSAVAMKVMPGGPAGVTEPAAGPAKAAAGHPASGDSSMLAGVRALWGAPVLRATMLLIMIVNTAGVGLDLIIIVILRGQHVRPGLIGAVLAAAAVGGLAGAPLIKPLHRVRPGVLLLATCMLEIPIFAGFAVPFGAWWVAGLLFVSTLAVPALRVLLDVLILRQTPDEQRGRVVAAVITLMGLGMPVGLAGSGLLLQWLPAQTATLTLAAGMAAGVLYCATKRELWRARWPR